MAIYIKDVQQGTRAWEELRLGIPTASQFSRLLTPKTLKLSAQRDAYLAELLAAWALGEPIEEFQDEWTERGKRLEPEARKYYQTFYTDAPVTEVAFIYKDADQLVGGSPDALVGEDGLLEIKCPKAGNHLINLARDVCPAAYVMQVQALLWVSGRDYCDFLSYYPELPPFLIRCIPDPKIQEAFETIVPVFVGEVLAARERLAALGLPVDRAPLSDEAEAIWEARDGAGE